MGGVAGAGHRPYIDGSRGPQLGGLRAVACRDCQWAQAVNEDLHEGSEALLLAWHAAYPDEGFDHLAERAPGVRLEIPGYVLWAENGDGAWSSSTIAPGACTAARDHPGAGRGFVRLIAASLYRAGLLRSARSDGSGAAPLPACRICGDQH